MDDTTPGDVRLGSEAAPSSTAPFRWTPHGGVEAREPTSPDTIPVRVGAHPWVPSSTASRPPQPGPSPFPTTSDRDPPRPDATGADAVEDGAPPPARRPAYHYPADGLDSPAPKPARPRRLAIAAFALFAGLLGAASTVAVLWTLGAFDEPTTTEPVAAPNVTIIERIRTELVPTETPNSTAVAVARKVVPSIVRVEVGDATSGNFEAFGAGSGVVLTSDGYIVTNEHVVEGATTTRVVFQDGRTYQAEIIGSDPLTDLAVLRIDVDDLIPIEIGATDILEIGETAIAVGNPLALSGGASLTVGVLSAFGREVEVGANQSLYGMLQTDAPITQGSSGGALVDDSGRLIGITTAIGVSSAGAEGIGFAIPVELVVRITDEIIELGHVRHAFLGILGTNFIAEAEDGALIPGGAIIDSFPETGSAAQAAGLEAGDRIVGVDGDVVSGMQDLIITLRMYRVGQSVELDVIRGEERIVATVVLEERPAEQ